MVRFVSRVWRQPRVLALAARALITDPIEVLLNIQAKVAEREELWGKRTKGVGGFMPWPPCPYEVDEESERRLHELIGAPWPCPGVEAFWELWSEVAPTLEGQGLELGRGVFGGWGDGEPGLVRAVWCLTRHLRPSKVVETGVARGITSRFILEALARNGTGHLWSIDLPPPREPGLHGQVGAAVTDNLRDRWTYVRGSSRRRLPDLLVKVGKIDLFIHDSRHSERNVLFELEHAWSALSPGGVVVVDDIDLNCGFHSFRALHARQPSLICHAEPLRPDYGRQDDRGVFGVMRNEQ
jgi:Methyltransferase domain